MDSKTVVDVRSGVFAITQEYHEASDLFAKWRAGKSGKRAVGAEECQTLLEEGKSTIEGKFQRCSAQHKARFDRGDRTCLDDLIATRARFKQDVLERLSRSVAGKLSKVEKIVPMVLIKSIEATRKETILAMDELSGRIGDGTAGRYTTTDPGDVLPHMPLRPMPTPPNLGSSPNSSQTSIASELTDFGNGKFRPISLSPNAPQLSYAQTLPGSANSSQSSLGMPFPSNPQRISAPMASSWTLPDFGTSQALVKSRPSSSTTAIAWMKDRFPVKPTRPYYDITPLKPTPAVVPTFTCEINTTDILEEGEKAAQRLWDAAECEENHRLREHAKSAPIPQGPWKGIFGEDDDDGDDGKFHTDRRIEAPQPPKKETPQTLPDEGSSQMFLRPILPGARPSSVYGDRRVRSQPKLEFSVVTPRFRRHVSNPEARPK